jgi:hypothetical protein
MGYVVAEAFQRERVAFQRVLEAVHHEEQEEQRERVAFQRVLEAVHHEEQEEQAASQQVLERLET